MSTDRDLLEHAAEVLWSLTEHCLTVKPTLSEPYRDMPEWTPWTRWIERDARRAHDLAMEIRKHLKTSQANANWGDGDDEDNPRYDDAAPVADRANPGRSW